LIHLGFVQQIRYEIHTMPEPLITKRGGHEDQLSKGWGLDRFRITALEKILTDPLLEDDLKPVILKDIVRRAHIVAEGAKKRGNISIAEQYENITHRRKP